MERNGLGRKRGRQDAGTGRPEKLEAMQSPGKQWLWPGLKGYCGNGEKGLDSGNLLERRIYPISRQIRAERKGQGQS